MPKKYHRRPRIYVGKVFSRHSLSERRIGVMAPKVGIYSLLTMLEVS